MKKVFCPKSGKIEWANEPSPLSKNKGRDPRCCKCGEIHAPARS